MTKHLPSNPSLQHLRNQAKRMLKARREENPDANIGLQECQHILAQDYGFKNWRELKEQLVAEKNGKKAEDTLGHHRWLIDRVMGLYELDVSSVDRVVAGSGTWPGVFQFIDTSGCQYRTVLVEQEEGAHRELKAAMVWLESLYRHSTVHVPAPIATRRGKFVTLVKAPDSLEAYQCAVTTWVPGQTLGSVKDDRAWHDMGVAAAQLHNYSESVTPTRRFDIPVAYGCCRGDASRWDADAVAWFSGIEGKEGQLFEAGRTQAVDALRQLQQNTGTGQVIVIHGGLWSGNAIVNEGNVYLIDFEHTCWGLPLHDLATFTYYELYHNAVVGNVAGHGARREVDSFRRGYATARNWPDTPELLTGLIIKLIMENAHVRGYEKDVRSLRRVATILDHVMNA